MGGSSKGETIPAGAVHCREEMGAEAPASFPAGSVAGETEAVTPPKAGVTCAFVLAKNKKPLMPCHPARVKELLRKGKAKVVRLYPFTIRLTKRSAGNIQPVELKLDPGAKHSGIALLTTKRILWLAEITHRKAAIQKAMLQRSGFRRRRRNANTRCRPARWLNRCRKVGWLPPSIQSIVDNLFSWIARLRRYVPVTGITAEIVKFDTQKLQNPEISGEEYQRGTLSGYEIWEYLLEKFNHTCVYCEKTDIPLTQDHVVPRASLGSNRVSNLVTSCLPCNQRKGKQPVETFLAGKPKQLAKIKFQLKDSMAPAAAANSSRNALRSGLESLGLPVTFSTGAQTKFNRRQHTIPKSHALDAAFTGDVQSAKNWNAPVLEIKAMGRGKHQRTKTDAFGFPRLYLPRVKMVHGFQTGDIVATPKGTGRIAVRSSGHFSLAARAGKTTVKHTQCRLVQRAYGYNYNQRPCQFLPTLTDGVSLAP